MKLGQTELYLSRRFHQLKGAGAGEQLNCTIVVWRRYLASSAWTHITAQSEQQSSHLAGAIN